MVNAFLGGIDSSKSCVKERPDSRGSVQRDGRAGRGLARSTDFSSRATLAVPPSGQAGRSKTGRGWGGGWKSGHGRDQPSPHINTCCVAIRAPASSTWAHSRKVVQRAPQSQSACPLLPSPAACFGAHPRGGIQALQPILPSSD